MKLEVKHLAPYLPYGLKVVSNELVPGKLYEMVVTNHTVSFDGGLTIADVLMQRAKPVLHLLSDFEKFENVTDEMSENEINELQRRLQFKVPPIGGYVYNLNVSAYNQMLESHIDVFGLIDAGLAVSISRVNV